MILLHPYEAVVAARRAQAAFRSASRRIGCAGSREERTAAVEAFKRAREALRAFPPELLREAAAELEACRFAAENGRRNPAGAERLRRWSRA